MDNILPPNRAKRFVKTYVAAVALIAAFGSGLLIGQTVNPTVGGGSFVPNAVASTVILNLDRSESHATNVDFNQFWQVWDAIKDHYVKTDVKDTDLFYGAIQGLVAGLGDPYSIYFPPQPAAEFSKSLAGEFSGIGAEIGVKNNQLLIIAPLPDSPAEKAGLKAGDKILAIDGKLTNGMDANVAVTMIRGAANTTTTLTIGREGVAKPKDYVLTRAKINIPSIMFKELPGKVAYLRVMQFNEDTMPSFEKYVAKIQNGYKGVVVDLRNNPGGYLESAVALSSEWIPDGRIVSEKFRDGSENIHYTKGLHRMSGIPTVVLINGGSASASEILAGALRDQGVATIVGEKSFGKGSVQDYQQLPDGSALKLTIAEWYTPKGVNINKKGVEPDVVVHEDFAKEKVGADSVIDKALQILKQPKAK